MTRKKATKQATTSTDELRKILMETITDVRSKKIGTKEANAIRGLAHAMVSSAKIDLDYAKLAKKFEKDLKPKQTAIGA